MRLPLIAVVACATLARAETRPRYGGTVEASLLGAPATLDPADARTHADLTVAGLVTDTLFQLGADGVVVPRLAAGDPTFDEKRTTVFIPIRKGVKLHDGSELTPADVVASLQREKAATRYLLVGMTGLKVDGDGIVLSLRAALPDLLVQLALPQFGITKGGKAGERPIGSGPFAVEALDRARKRLTLRAFDEHFAGRPYVDQLVLTWYDTPDGEARRFETGKSHVSMRGATAFAGQKPTFRTEDVEGPPSLLVYVGFGSAHREILTDKAFRRSLDAALARGGLAAITSGERVIPTKSALPVEVGGLALDAKGRASDIDTARAQLADAQRRIPALAEGKLAALRLEILVDDTRPDDKEIAERVVLALDKLGIGAMITALPATVLRDRISKGTTDLWIGQLAQPLTTPALWWASAFHAGGDDALMPQLAAGTVDMAVAGKEFSARLPILPLMFRSVRLWHLSNLRGVAFDAFGRPSYAEVSLFGNAISNKARPSPP